MNDEVVADVLDEDDGREDSGDELDRYQVGGLVVLMIWATSTFGYFLRSASVVEGVFVGVIMSTVWLAWLRHRED